MTIVLNGTSGITTPPVSVEGSTSGTITLAAPAVAGTNTQTLVAVTDTLAPIVRATAVASTSGTSIDFTGIPSWVKRITVMFNGVSTSGNSILQIQIGDSGGVETTSYLSSAVVVGSAVSGQSSTTGFALQGSSAGLVIVSGIVVLALQTGTTWVASGNLNRDDTTGFVNVTAGKKALSDVLDRVRITTVNGTDTFDAGSINILYE
jgi:hypothetical protein